MLADDAEPVFGLVAVLPAALAVDDFLQQLVHRIELFASSSMSFAAAPASSPTRDAGIRAERKPTQVPIVIARDVVNAGNELGQFAQRLRERGSQCRDRLHSTSSSPRAADALRQRADARVDLVEPLQRRAQTQPEREVLLRLVGQVMRFVEHVDRVGGIGQHSAAAEREIGQHEVEIRNDDVGFVELARAT